jgi:homoserine kinase type II
MSGGRGYARWMPRSLRSRRNSVGPTHSEMASILRDAYGFDAVVVGERLEGGYANDLFRIRADGAAFVLRLKLPPVVEDDIAWEHELTRVLSLMLPEVVPPVATRDGRAIVDLGSRTGCLLPFIDGEPARPERSAHRTAAARGLGRLHRRGRGLELPARPRLRPLRELEWPSTRVPAELREWSATIAAARRWAISYTSEIAQARALPTGIVHGDYFPGNVLISGDELVGIIDWEEAQLDWLIWDLANAINTFCAVDDDLDREACRGFVDAYRTAGGVLLRHDEALVVPLVRVKRILEVLRAPTDRHPRWDHQRRNLRSLQKLEARTG